MTIGTEIAKQIRDMHFGGSWTAVHWKDQLADVTWREATAQVEDNHSIAALAYHMNYFIGATVGVLKGGPLDASDKFSFDVPAIQNDSEWNELRTRLWEEAEAFATLVEAVPDERMWEDFADGNYGNVWRNLIGIIEHAHYHLGQVVTLKKMIRS